MLPAGRPASARARDLLLAAGAVAGVATGCGYDFGGVVFDDTTSATSTTSTGGPATGVTASSAAIGGGDPASTASGNGGGGEGAGDVGGAPATSSSSGGEGGSGVTSSTATTTSTGGECTSEIDCDDAPGVCCVADCADGGVCGSRTLAEGSRCGDAGQVCDENGACVACVTAADCPAAEPPCHAAVRCQGSKCVAALQAEGTPCTGGGGVCNAEGACLECLPGTTCPDGTTCGSLGQCLPFHCSNNAVDPGEIDLNCGGGCEPCETGTVDCNFDTDCTGVCDELGDGSCVTCSVGECLAGFYCDEAGACVPSRPRGTPCAPGGVDPCDFGTVCNDEGVCCDRPCNEAGVSCTSEQTGQPTGTCAPILPLGGEHAACGP